jgi:hypothetical protein
MAAREMKKQDTEGKAVHEMTAAERAAIERHFARCEATPSIRCKVSRNGSDLQIRLDHPDEQIGQPLMMDASRRLTGLCKRHYEPTCQMQVGAARTSTSAGSNFYAISQKAVKPRPPLFHFRNRGG